MSYAKKDEDADQLGFKLDRTSVFQDGTMPASPFPLPATTLTDHSTVVQLVTHISAKMSNSPHEDCRASLYWREVPNHRSHHPFLCHIQTFPEQRSVVTADGLPHSERACTHCRRCYHVYKHYHEGWQSRKRTYISRQCDSGALSNNRRKELPKRPISSTNDVGNDRTRY